MSADAKIFAMGLREVAGQFSALRSTARDDLDEDGRIEFMIASQELRGRAGRILIAATDKGFFPELKSLAAWASGNAPHPHELPGKCNSFPCPDNFFGAVVGNGQVPIQLVNGKPKVIGKPRGGLLPGEYPDVFEPSPTLRMVLSRGTGVSPQERMQMEREYLAAVAASCEAMAIKLEERQALSVQADDKFPADHYKAKYGIDADKLDKQRRRGKLPSAEKRGARWFYSLVEVRKINPDAFIES